MECKNHPGVEAVNRCTGCAYSSKGTFIDGRRINSSYKAEGAFVAQLGDDDSGTPRKVITAGEHRSPRSQSLFLLIAVGVLALVAILALALALRNRGNGETVTVSAPPGQVPMEVRPPTWPRPDRRASSR